MQWTAEADAKLCVAIVQNYVGTVNFAALAEAMGEGVTPKAIQHRVQKLRGLGKDKAPTPRTRPASTRLASTNDATMVPATGDSPSKAGSRSTTKRKRAPAAQGEEAPKAKKPRADLGVKEESKTEDAETEELPLGKEVVVKDGQLKLADSGDEN